MCICRVMGWHLQMCSRLLRKQWMAGAQWKGRRGPEPPHPPQLQQDFYTPKNTESVLESQNHRVIDLRIGGIPGSIPDGLAIRTLTFKSNVGFLSVGWCWWDHWPLSILVFLPTKWTFLLSGRLTVNIQITLCPQTQVLIIAIFEELNGHGVTSFMGEVLVRSWFTCSPRSIACMLPNCISCNLTRDPGVREKTAWGKFPEAGTCPAGGLR